MKKVNNPYIGRNDHFCFGCAPDNDAGLQMEFFESENEVVSKWRPRAHHQGFRNVLHGGIQATLMDEIAAWFVFVKLKTAGVTSKIDVKYKRPVIMDKGEITLKARLTEMNRNVAQINVKLFDADDTLCAEGNVYYFTFDKEKAKEKLGFPEPDEFIKEKEV